MPTRHLYVTSCEDELSGIHVDQREADDGVKLAALREAARIGLADFTVGWRRTFSTSDNLRAHLRTRWQATFSSCD